MAKQRNARVLFIEGCGSDLAFLSERAIRSGTHIGRQRRLLRLQLCFQLSSVPACSDCADVLGRVYYKMCAGQRRRSVSRLHLLHV